MGFGKIIIISDLHLTKAFDQKKFDYLYKLFNSCDTLISNGDFWSYYSCTFDEFLNSKWIGLLALMKQKKCIYIYGNHDRRKWCDSRIKIFSNLQTESYDLAVGDKSLKIMHGHTLAYDSIQNEEYIKLNRMLQVDRLNYFTQGLIAKHFGISFLTRVGVKINAIHKDYARGLKSSEILVTSHTHAPEVSVKDKFINIGFINYGYSFYLRINDDDFELISERY